MQWNVVTHAGNTIHQTKAENGFCSWIYAYVGVRLWGIIQPKYTSNHNTLQKVNALQRDIMQSEPKDLDKHADVFPIFLSPGELL
jgi:hypothetical protein